MPARLQFRLWLLLAAALGLGGCATPLPPAGAWPASTHRLAPVDAPLSQLAAEPALPPGRSGFRPLLLSSVAMDTRLALIEQAVTGLDLQTYLLGDDATGRQVLRALRDAARRGVRVRLLVDDLYTSGMTDLLLGLAAHPGVELRVYNPFLRGRDSQWLRLANLLGDFDRLNRRMHNKLLIADGRAAIVGGRNLADAYFMRDAEANFLDFDLLCVGAVAPQLAGHFDTFWNSRFAVPLSALADDGLTPPQRRASFDRLIGDGADGADTRKDASEGRSAGPDAAPAGRPGAGNRVPPPAVRAALQALGELPLVVADAEVFFDSPDKTAGQLPAGKRLPVADLLDSARERVVIVSPYFLPSETGLARMRAAQARGVSVQVITNSLRDSDEPLVSLAYGQRRQGLLAAGVRLFELSSERLRRLDPMRQALGDSVGRLHAKLGFVDDEVLLVGSMNLDPRSASTNTELGLAIRSPALVRLVLGQFQPTDSRSSYEVRLDDDGQSLVWLAADEDGIERRTPEPVPPWWQRLKLWLLSRLIPDDLL